MIAFTHDTQTLVLFAAYSAIVLACLAWILARLESRRARRLRASPRRRCCPASSADTTRAAAAERADPPLRCPAARRTCRSALGRARRYPLRREPGNPCVAGHLREHECGGYRAEPPGPRATKIQMLLERYPAGSLADCVSRGGAGMPADARSRLLPRRAGIVGTTTLTVEGTDIEAALAEAEKVFEDGLGRGYGSVPGDRIVLLISDGEAVSGDAIPAAERLADYARVAVLGSGTRRAPK